MRTAPYDRTAESRRARRSAARDTSPSGTLTGALAVAGPTLSGRRSCGAGPGTARAAGATAMTRTGSEAGAADAGAPTAIPKTAAPSVTENFEKYPIVCDLNPLDTVVARLVPPSELGEHEIGV